MEKNKSSGDTLERQVLTKKGDAAGILSAIENIDSDDAEDD